MLTAWGCDLRRGTGERAMIQGIGSQSDLYSAYNRIQSRRTFEDESVRSLAGQAQNPQNNQQDKDVTVAPKEMDLRLGDIKPRQNLSIEEVSISLNESASTFEMKGRESNIEDLDMEKAVSDMQKDKALMQYQYFVGDSNPFMSTEDGIVIPK